MTSQRSSSTSILPRASSRCTRCTACTANIARARRRRLVGNRQCRHFAAPGGAVAANDGRAEIRSNHAGSLGCPGRQRRSGLRASSPRAQANVICAILRVPFISGWAIPASQRPVIRALRCASCSMTPGDCSFLGRVTSRPQTESPSTRLLARASRRRASHASLPAGRSNIGLPSMWSSQAQTTADSSMPASSSRTRYGTRPGGLIL